MQSAILRGGVRVRMRVNTNLGEGWVIRLLAGIDPKNVIEKMLG